MRLCRAKQRGMSYAVSASASRVAAGGGVYTDGELQSWVGVACAWVMAGEVLRCGTQDERCDAYGGRGGVPHGGARRVIVPGRHRVGEPERERVLARVLVEQVASVRV